jgi:Mrp family chromosome partitioning ATPase
MLGSTAMETFCKTVRERFDIVIFDSPPAMTVTDAIVLTRIMDGLIIVIKSGETMRETARRAISQLTGNRCEMLGVVVNYVDISRGSYYYHYYRYGYDSEEDAKETEKI